MARTPAGRRRERAGDIKLSITPSGKVIWRDKYPSEYKGWSPSDHLYAAIIHGANRTRGGEIAEAHRALAGKSRAISPADVAEAHRTGASLAGRRPHATKKTDSPKTGLPLRGSHATARSHSTKKPKKQLKIYNVDASIIAGNSGEAVWEGSFELPAVSKKEAGQRALDILHDSPYYDDRIDPRADFQVWLNYSMSDMTAEDIAQETRAFIKKAREEVGASST